MSSKNKKTIEDVFGADICRSIDMYYFHTVVNLFQGYAYHLSQHVLLDHDYYINAEMVNTFIDDMTWTRPHIWTRLNR